MVRGLVHLTLLSLVLYTSEVAVAQTALASGAEEMIVRLRDGSVYRGIIVELIPQDHVLLRLSSGELRKVAASDITSQEFLPPPPPAMPLPAVPQPLYVVPPSAVPISLNADDPQAGLYQQDAQLLAISLGGRRGTVETWRRICGVPCQAYVDPLGTYKIGGGGITESRSFNLPAGGPVSITARVGHRGAVAGGLMLLGLGGAMLLGGAVVLGVGYGQSKFGESSSFFADTRQTGENMIKAGGAMLGLSPVPIIAGILIIMHNRTLVHTESRQRLALHLSPTGRLAF